MVSCKYFQRKTNYILGLLKRNRSMIIKQLYDRPQVLKPKKNKNTQTNKQKFVEKKNSAFPKFTYLIDCKSKIFNL